MPAAGGGKGGDFSLPSPKVPGPASGNHFGHNESGNSASLGVFLKKLALESSDSRPMQHDRELECLWT